MKKRLLPITARWPLHVHDQARLKYGRLLWKRPSTRARLLRHWADSRHRCAERFMEENRPLVKRVLSADPADDEALHAELYAEGKSLHAVVRQIPPVFGPFY